MTLTLPDNRTTTVEPCVVARLLGRLVDAGWLDAAALSRALGVEVRA